jgi:hypothetical protein
MPRELATMTKGLLRAALIGALAIGSLALWIGIPAGWMWATREIEGGGRFVLVVVGCIASMWGAAVLLFRLEDFLNRVSGTPEREPGPPSWRRPASGGQRSEPLSLLGVFLVISAIIAVIALVVWWAFFADSSNPSGPLQPV